MLADIQINNELLEEAIFFGEYTKYEIINKALEEYVQKRKRLEIIKYFGTFDFDPEYDYKEERKRR